MDVKIVFLIVCLCAMAITSTEAGIPSCCMTANKAIPVKMLMKVQRWKMQESGACDIRALLLFVRHLQKPLCGHPRLRKILEKINEKKRRSS